MSVLVDRMCHVHVLWSRIFLNELFFSDDNVQQMASFFLKF